MKVVAGVIAVVLLVVGVLLFNHLEGDMGGVEDGAETNLDSARALQQGDAPPSESFELTLDRTKPKEGIPVEGKGALMISPYNPESGFIDVTGLAAGTKIEDPFSEKYIIVPEFK